VPAAALPPTELPVEAAVEDLRRALAEVGAAVLQAPPGAGKTTVVPLRLLDEAWAATGVIVMLEPRRVAARAAASRMATLLSERVGDTVGYVTRDDRRNGPRTRIQVVTDGILTRRLQADPSLDGTAAVIFDEVHERHLQADLGLALTVDVRRSLRPELRVLAMSATLETDRLARLLDDAPVLRSEGRTFPVTIEWRPGAGPAVTGSAGGGGDRATMIRTVTAAVRQALQADAGDVLTFLPGVGEIRAVQEALADLGGRVDVAALHGGLNPAEQDRALRAGPGRRVILATDLAETSVTVEGVRVVVDAGLVRRPEYDPASGLSRLRTGLASRAAADQRAGRAGREAPGLVMRLWSEADHAARQAWPRPEMAVADLAPVALEVALWGSRPEDLAWLDPPPAAAWAVAQELLELLGALDQGRPTALGRRLAELPVHPRLGRMLLRASSPGRRRAALLAALLSERDIYPRGSGPGRRPGADVEERLRRLERDAAPAGPGDRVGGVVAEASAGPRGAGPGVDRAALLTVRQRAEELLRRTPAGAPAEGPEAAGPLLAEAYPDRLAQSRGGGRFRLRGGQGAFLAEDDGLAGVAWLVAAEVEAGDGRSGRADGRIRLAAALDRDDVERAGGHAVTTQLRVEWDEAAGDVRAVRERVLGALVLESARASAEPGAATTAALVSRAVSTRLAGLAWTPADRRLQARVAWARQRLADAGPEWPDLSDEALVAGAESWLPALLAGARGAADLRALRAKSVLDWLLGPSRGALDRLVPDHLDLGGRPRTIHYDEHPRVAIRVQDLYGVTVHPAIGGGRVPLTLELLSPAGRPLQVTADLPGFWAGSWREVRRAMAGRYPKHAWPEDPTRAAPPARRGPGTGPTGRGR
jgi:ATP-dependent helicase HrpB